MGRVRSSTKRGLTMTDFYNTLLAGAIDGGGGGGGEADYSAITDGTLSGELDIRNATSVRAYGCSYLPNITSVKAPNLVQSGDHGFFNCTSLEYAVFPSCTQLQPSSLRGCTSLKGVDIYGRPEAQSISNQSMLGDTVLTTLILRNPNSVVQLNSTNTFEQSPFHSNGTGGTLYVPDALLSSYETATNWSTILGYTNNQIKKIEGTTYETHYVDGSTIGA